MSSWRLRRAAEARGVPSARGGNAVGLSRSFLSRREVVRLQTVCTSRKSGVAVLFRCDRQLMSGRDVGGQLEGESDVVVTEEWLFPGWKICYRDFWK
jgi:hypothetical protein